MDEQTKLIAQLQLEVATLKAVNAKVENLYATLSDKHSALVSAHRALIEREFPTKLPNE